MPASNLPRLTLLTALLVGPLVHSASVVAAPKEPRPAPSASTSDDAAVDEAAKARYAEGVRLYTKKRYEEARVAFLQAAALKRRPASTLMLAQSSLKAGRWLEAARQFDVYVEEVGEVPPKVKDIVSDGRREARVHLGRLRFDIPEGADVNIDGERIPSVEQPLDVMPGQHTIIVTYHDDKKTETIEALPGTTVDVKPNFAPKAIIPPSETRARPPAPSRSDEPTKSSEEPKSDSPGLLSPPKTTWPLYVTGVVGLGGLALAAVFGGLKANATHAVDVTNETILRQNKVPTGCDDPGGLGPEFADTCLTRKRNTEFARSYEQTFGLALLAGVAGSVIALGWFFFSPKDHGEKADKPPAKESHLVPWLGKDSGGAAFEGRF